jgi:hypothetical protein
MDNKKRILLLSLFLAPWFPFMWIYEKGNLIKFYDVFKYNFSDMFFDFTRLAINFFIIFFLMSKFLNAFKDMRGIER